MNQPPCLALNAWTFPKELPVAEQLAACAQAGFGGLELVVGTDGPLQFDATIVAWRDIRTAAAASGVAITSLASAAFFQAHFASAEDAARRLAFDRTLRLLDGAALVGAASVVVIPAVVGRAADAKPQASYGDALRRTHDALATLRVEAERRGVNLAIENVWNRFLLSPVEAADLVDRVNSPNVGWCLDTGNVLVCGYPDDWIRTLGGRLLHVHVKDYDLNRPGRDGFVPLGEGSVDWPAVRRALHEVNYRGPLVFEGSGQPEEIIERMKRLFGSES
ncbi:MAG: sugar phosphate isomerase/epimerase [Planctomycetes bacterium]|nr:sugar phosphate isomerase/epimerase [Planctomycetota bacterium]